MLKDREEIRLAKLEGFKECFDAMHLLQTGKKPAVAEKRGPGRPIGSRNKRRDDRAVMSISTGRPNGKKAA